MKTIRIVLTATLLAGPLLGRAQKNIEQVMTKLKKQQVVFNVQSTVDKHPTTLALTGRVQVLDFCLPPAKASLLADARAAFDKDAAKAYKTVDNGHTSTPYFFAEQLIVGRDFSHLRIACFADKADSTRRTAYALEWEKTAGDSIKGRITCHYGRMPKPQTSVRRSVFSLDNWKGNLQTLNRDSLISRLMKAKDTQFAIIPDELKQSGSDDYLSAYNAIKDKAAFKQAEDMTPAEWLAQVNAQVKLVRKYPKGGSTTLYLATLYRLCSHHPAALGKEEKALAAKELRKLQDKVTDEMGRGLLSMSLDALK